MYINKRKNMYMYMYIRKYISICIHTADPESQCIKHRVPFIYIYTYICMDVYKLLYILKYTYTYSYIGIKTNACIHTADPESQCIKDRVQYISMYIWMYVKIYTYTYIHTYIYVYMDAYKYIYILKYTYIYTYIGIQTYR
jgi:hypothetical protein